MFFPGSGQVTDVAAAPLILKLSVPVGPVHSADSCVLTPAVGQVAVAGHSPPEGGGGGQVPARASG